MQKLTGANAIYLNAADTSIPTTTVRWCYDELTELISVWHILQNCVDRLNQRFNKMKFNSFDILRHLHKRGIIIIEI